MSIWHGLSSIAQRVQFVPFPNMFLHLISRMPCRHREWKACNGFMYRLHVGFPCSHSVELCRQLFLMFKFCNLFHVSEKGRRLSQVVLHMSADDVATGKDISHISERSNCLSFSLMVKAGGFTQAQINRRRVYVQTNNSSFYCSFEQRCKS